MATVDLSARLKEWRSQLLDTTRRNRLVNCKFARGGALLFEYPDLSAVWESLVASQSEMIFQSTDPLNRRGRAMARR